MDAFVRKRQDSTDPKYQVKENRHRLIRQAQFYDLRINLFEILLYSKLRLDFKINIKHVSEKYLTASVVGESHDKLASTMPSTTGQA